MAGKFKLENNPLFSSAGEDQPQEAPAQEVKRGRGRPRKDGVVRGVSVQEGLTAEYTRATFIVDVALLKWLKDYAYTERLSMKDAINGLLQKALTDTMTEYEKDGKELLEHK